MQETTAAEAYAGMDIAIIGMAGRFPGAPSIEQFWHNLSHGIESIAFFSDEELRASGIDERTFSNPNYVRARGIIEDADMFDADFFGFFPKEAENLDPQHRLFLECAWQVLENAGYCPESYPGLIGVFGGVGMNTYIFPLLAATRGKIDAAAGYQVSIGNEKDFLTTKVSYKLNLLGPSLDVQTACSTSLTAVFLACQSLIDLHSDMAIAGGCTITFPQKSGFTYQEGMILSPDGHCRAFDAAANGTIAGNGCGLVLLKRLEDALADNDYIHAVIKGAAINNDGALKVGYTAPSVDGQAQVITSAQVIAGVEPDDISYVETHGTGTNLGDPIEMTALTKVFRAKTDRRQFCAIGSVKPNIGHLDAAAGIASLIKTVLALQHKQIPPSINFSTPNPKLDIENSPFFVNTELRDWDTNGAPRFAGVSSFGIGGTNVHLVLQEAPERVAATRSRPHQLLLLSARSPQALARARENLVNHLEKNPTVNLADVAFTLQLGRRGFNHRMAAVCHSREDAIAALGNVDPERVMVFSHNGEVGEKSVVFMFSGQGAQYANMGRDLYENEPTFRDVVNECCDYLAPTLGLDLRTILYPEKGEEAAAQEQLAQTRLTQPALFIIEYALAELWREWGITPQAMIGHSIGEYVAACLAGVMSLEDALTLVALRGELMQSMPAGAMLSVNANAETLQKYLGDGLSLAAHNSENLCVASGDFAAIAGLETKLAADHIEFTRLHTSHAFHSAMMEPILEPFARAVDQVLLSEPNIPYISNLTGTWITAEEATDPQYYARHLRSTVNFSGGIGELLADFDYIFLEVGPGSTLSTLTRRHPNVARDQAILSSLRRPKEKGDDQAFILNTLGRLWLAGGAVNWEGFDTYEVRQRIPLPTYPFEKQRYWMDVDLPEIPAKRGRPKGNSGDVGDWFYTPVWKRAWRRPTTKPVENVKYLVFVDLEFDETVLDRLREAGHNVRVVVSGSDFRIDDDKIIVRPEQEEHYQKLLAHLAAIDFLPDRILHAWTMSSRDAKNSLQRGFYSLLWLVKALAQQGFTKNIHINIATRAAFDVTGAEDLVPENAALAGACKVIPQEYANIRCTIIDTDEYNLDCVFDEFDASQAAPAVCYRNRLRWVQKFEPFETAIKFPVADPAAAGRRDLAHESFDATSTPASLLKKNGVYLITGGLGNIGLTLAEFLAERYAARLVLVDRLVLPERAEWPATVETGEVVLAGKIKRIMAMEAKGAEVLALTADVVDENQMRHILQKTRAHFSGLNGFIHAAGLVGEAATVSIANTNAGISENQFAPKISGGRVLANILGDSGLDFVILQSSLASILGGLGMYAYAAANAYLDALAAIQNKQSTTVWTSVNWGGWRFGDAAKTAAEDYMLTPAEGTAAFDLLLQNMGFPQMAVSTGDLAARLDKWVNFTKATEAKPVAAATKGAHHPRPNLTTPYIEPRNELESQIAGIWGELLGIDSIGIYDNFFDLGGHSLLATQLVSRMRDAYKIELPLRDLFESPTIATISDVIQKNKTTQATEADKIAQALAMVENLSDEEVEVLLAQQKER